MALIHAAYTFDAQGFHRELEAKLIVNNQLRLEVLYDLAASVVAAPSATTQEILDLLRLDAELLEPPTEEDVSYTDAWYMIVLADKLTPAPSLSHRCLVSHLVLQYGLPLLGWSADEIRLLLSGEPMHRLIEAFGHPLFVAEFWCNEYGGWLSIERAAPLLSRLLLVENFFPSPLLEARKEITDLAGWWSRSPAELLSQAYADAREMLETSLARKQSLFLGVFD